jgi:methylase of polypeptide subunit release factors
MDLNIKKEINYFIKNPDSLLGLSEFDIRNNILKLFRGLEWNVYNEGLSPFDYEVLQERTIQSGRPDLTFLIGGEKKFYIETKKATVELSSKDVWQAWKYAWNSGLPFSILSNFIYTWLIDCRATPPGEPPKDWKSLIVKSWNFSKYIQDFQEIKDYLGKDAVRKGSLVELESILEESVGTPSGIMGTLFPLKGLQPVDSLFLNQLDLWRIKIAKNLYSRHLDKERIIELTDKIINFVVFVRFLEDRGLLHNISLKSILDKSLDQKGILSRELNALRSQLNLIYNGTVFKEENGFSLDEPILTDIIYNLYAPQSPYLFDYISVDILGTIYERFLGKKITADSKTVKYKDEKESKKAQKEGGVYYTERYITNFMVNQILRQVLDPSAPEKMFNLSIADITCGSGSFLISVYRNMIFWFESICSENIKLREEYLERLADGSWKLKIDHKIKLLENCIYGVDIDSEAVDVTKFSLYLQLLEGETEKGIKSFFNRKRRPVLPILDRNIKCGNSLVDYSIAEESLYSDEVEKIIKPFNLKEFFKDVFHEGGFDVIVGNPPYNAKLHELEKKYCQRYALSKGNYNSANLFIERVDVLTKPHGAWTLIVPKSLIYSEKWVATRNYIRGKLFSAIDASKAFKEVKLEQVIIGCGKAPDMMTTGSISKAGNKTFIGKKQLSFTDILPVNISDEEIEIGEKIVKNSASFREYFQLLRGMVPLTALRETGEVKVYQGKYIQGYHFIEPGKGISEEEIKDYGKLTIPKLMFQQIVSHALSPSPHVRLVGAIDLKGTNLSIDTVSNIFIKKKVPHLKDSEALLLALAVLNSRVMSWFADRFIYAKAIRTMHFDNYQLNKMRFPANMKDIKIKDIIKLVQNLIAIGPENSRFREKAGELEKLINANVAKIFGLASNDIAYIDSIFGDEYLCAMGLLGKL